MMRYGVGREREREREERVNPEGDSEMLVCLKSVDLSSESSGVGVRKHTVWVDTETCV